MSSGNNEGKVFESIFKRDFIRTFPKSFILRLQDSQSGYKYTSSNPCDFICQVNKKIFMCELKSTKENTLSFFDIPQYDKLISYKDKEDVYPGVLI